MFAIKAKYLVKNSEEFLTNAFMLISDNKIHDILSEDEFHEKYKDIKVIDEKDNLIMPSFVNAHMHQYGVLSRGIPNEAEFNDFEGFLNEYWWPYIEDRIGLEEVLITAKASAVELLETGVTAFCDTLEAPFVEDGSLIEQAKLIESMGLKAILSLESSERAGKESGLKCLNENVNLIKWTKENSKNIQGMICTHTSFTCSEEFIKIAKNLAVENNAKMQFHLSESIYEPNYIKKHFSKTPVEHYNDLAVLDENTLASQCVKVNKDEIKILAKNKVKVVHMPISNCEVGGGFAPIVELLNAGVDVALGTDGYVNDFFELMRFAFLLHKAVHEDTTVLPANQVFKMATENGALALGYKNLARLEKGMSADFIVLDNQFKTPITKDNIYDQIVVHGKKEYVKSVFADGKQLVDNFKVIDLDYDKLKFDMQKNAKKFWKI